MSTTRPLLLGAVAYDPKVVTIWEGFKTFFSAQGIPFDYTLYSNYERQVEAHFAGQIDVAWNSPLAWVRSERLARAQGLSAEAVAMRDSDQDLTSIVLVRSDASVRSIEELRGKVVAVGAIDSPQATLIPLSHLRAGGLQPGTHFRIAYHDVLGGKHGDHIGGERDAVRALLAGKADAACIIDANHLLFSKEGTLASGATRILTQTAPYDHCNFTVLSTAPRDPVAAFREALLAMSYEDANVRALMDMEGLKAWRPGRTEGYRALDTAVDELKFYDRDGNITEPNYRY